MKFHLFKTINILAPLLEFLFRISSCILKKSHSILVILHMIYKEHGYIMYSHTYSASCSNIACVGGVQLKKLWRSLLWTNIVCNFGPSGL